LRRDLERNRPERLSKTHRAIVDPPGKRPVARPGTLQCRGGSAQSAGFQMTANRSSGPPAAWPRLA
jgi:hypothetical protein